MNNTWLLICWQFFFAIVSLFPVQFLSSWGTIASNENRDVTPRLRHAAANEIRCPDGQLYDPPYKHHQICAVGECGLLVLLGGIGTYLG